MLLPSPVSTRKEWIRMSLPSPSSVIVNTCRAAYCILRSDYVDSRYKRRPMRLPSVEGSRNHGRSNCGCYGGQPSPGVDLAGASPVSAQMWEGEPNSRRRCGGSIPALGRCLSRGARWRHELAPSCLNTPRRA